MKRASLIALVMACLPGSGRLAAHPVPFSYLDLRLGPGAIEASIVIHNFDFAHELTIVPPERLLDPVFARAQESAMASIVAARLWLAADGRRLDVVWTGPEIVPDRQSLRFTATIPLAAPPGTVAVDGTLFPYDERHQTFINVYEGDAISQAVIDRHRPRYEYFSGTRQGVAAVVSRFIPSGIHHILIGPDHILFLVGLLLTGGSIGRLALIVTGFTLAHSVTLTIAALDWLTPPAWLIEPAIALSVVYVGIDNLLVRGGRDVRGWIAFGFGFIHGFGFANVLREMGLPASALGWSLFSFNVGVEIGQLAVVAVVATALAAVRARSEGLHRRLVVAGSIAVIGAGSFWFVERVVFPGGM